MMNMRRSSRGKLFSGTLYQIQEQDDILHEVSFLRFPDTERFFKRISLIETGKKIENSQIKEVLSVSELQII